MLIFGLITWTIYYSLLYVHYREPFWLIENRKELIQAIFMGIFPFANIAILWFIYSEHTGVKKWLGEELD